MVISLQSHLTYKVRNVFPPCSVLSSRVPCFVRILCGYPDRQHKYWIIKQPRTANILTSPAAPNIAELKQRACTKYVRRYSEVVVRLLSKFKKLLSRLVCFRYHVTSGIPEIKRFNFYFLDLTGKYSHCIWYTNSQRAHNILLAWSPPADSRRRHEKYFVATTENIWTSINSDPIVRLEIDRYYF